VGPGRSVRDSSVFNFLGHEDCSKNSLAAGPERSHCVRGWPLHVEQSRISSASIFTEPNFIAARTSTYSRGGSGEYQQVNFEDMNSSWKVPSGYTLTNIAALGALTRLEFRLILAEEVSIVNVYVNDQGREVFRTSEEDDLYIEPKPRLPRFGFLPSCADTIGDLFERLASKLEAVCQQKW
jgi:hypothetical protein